MNFISESELNGLVDRLLSDEPLRDPENTELLFESDKVWKSMNSDLREMLSDPSRTHEREALGLRASRLGDAISSHNACRGRGITMKQLDRSDRLVKLKRSKRYGKHEKISA